MKLSNWIRRALATAAMVAVAVAGASAQTYPDRAITMVVPVTPGGVSDTTARPLAIGMGVNLGQSIVIDNKGGVGGAIRDPVARLARSSARLRAKAVHRSPNPQPLACA